MILFNVCGEIQYHPALEERTEVLLFPDRSAPPGPPVPQQQAGHFRAGQQRGPVREGWTSRAAGKAAEK